jgi:hypothetical protein
MIEAESQTSASGEGITMSTLAEKLKARRAATQTVEAVGETQARKAATQSSPSVATSTEVATPAVVPEVIAPTPEPVVEPVVATVIPPDAPGGDKVPEKAEGIMATLAKRRSSKTETPVKAAVVVEPTPEPVVTPPAKVEYVEPSIERQIAVVEAIEKIAEIVKDQQAKDLSLYVDCYPEKAEFDTLRALEDEIAARTPSLLEHLRKTSPKDVPEGTMDLGEVLFGRGYSTLSASFAVKPITGAWTVSTLGPASSKVLEVLLPKATFVVRGRR